MLDKLLRLTRKARADQGVGALLEACRRLVSERGQANVYALAQDVMARYRELPAARREAFFAALATEWSPAPEAVLAAAQRYAATPSADHLAALTAAVEPPRQELLRRINRAPGATPFLLAMRCDLLALRKGNPELAAVDADFLHLLSSWFNPGFLRLERVDWHASAALLEQLIEHEAVHEINGWHDLRHRLLPDRRCYAFFHPQLPDEPLIFVEVALVHDMAEAIAPLIDPAREMGDPERARTAVFYSISNCQPGLRGVSLGNFLIKRVASVLKAELPQLKTFCTLSPVPGFTRWLDAQAVETVPAKLRDWRATHAQPTADDVRALDKALQQDLLRLCARFLVQGSHGPQADPVARFHLDNGARLERINWAADLSRKGVRQSLGLMVNYLYELDQVETRHQQFVERRVSHSSPVRRLLKPLA